MGVVVMVLVPLSGGFRRGPCSGYRGQRQRGQRLA
jgi:hypothetical protein